MADLEAVVWSSRLPPENNLPDAERLAVLARCLIECAAATAPDESTGKLAALIGSCLTPGLASDTVCRVALDVINPRDVVMVVFDDGRPPIAKVYLGTHTPAAPYPEFACYHGEYLVLWAATPEVVALVPKDEVACLWPVRAMWCFAEGWQPFASYPFSDEQKARLDRFDTLAIVPEQLIPHYDVHIDTGVPRG